MTRKQFDKKYRELVRTTTKSLREYGDKAFKSGALDVASFEDNYRLPKIIMTAACEDMMDEWMPPDKAGRKEVKNLRCFI